MQTPITVTALNNQIKTLLESTFLHILVEGEVSRVTYHSSGHLYFTLKDENSSISCVMFRGNNRNLKFRLEEGLRVIINGSVSVYTPRGSYQINCIMIEPAGAGALALAYEQLKKKLEAKGYFDKEKKKSIPRFVNSVALVTSKTGAALQDMKRVAAKRWPLVKIILIDTLVQGEGAALAIAKNIKRADTLGVDVIIIARGGGSLEDLWAFNEEIVADAVFGAKTPIVSAVGHEIDFMISDFTADLRAPTPSAAMEMILPDINEMRIYIDNLFENYDEIIKRVLQKKEESLKHLFYLYKQNNLLSKIELFQKETADLKNRYESYLAFLLQKKENSLKDVAFSLDESMRKVLSRKSDILLSLHRSFENNDPSKKSKKGFAQIVKDGKITALEELEKGDNIELLDAYRVVEASVTDKRSC